MAVEDQAVDCWGHSWLDMPSVKDVAMNDLVDRVTRFLGSASNIIFVGHPMKTSLGVFVGLALSTFIKLFTPLLSNLSPVINFSAILDWEFVVLGIVLLHVGTIRYYLLKKGGILTENEERVLAVIRAAKRQGMPQKAVTRMYLELCEQELAIANRGLAAAKKPDNLSRTRATRGRADFAARVDG